MRVHRLLGACLVLVMASSCGSSDTCDAPKGCLRVERVAGACQCLEWETVRVETVPIKFVVVSVVYGAIGNGSELWYGWTAGTPPASSELGSRLRAVVRAADGSERAATMTNVDQGDSFPGPLRPVTPESAAMLLAWGDGSGSGSADGFLNGLDAPGASGDRILVWANPTLTLTTNFVGDRQASWSWTAVGHCFWPLPLGCTGPHVIAISPDELDGTRPPVDFFVAQFLTTLSPVERETILRYHPLYDPAGRDPATLAADPRFLTLGSASVYETGSSSPIPAWNPCVGALSDAAFEVLHQADLPLPGSAAQLLLQHSVISAEADCRTQQPGIALATRTPGCSMAATVYLDRMFGTLLFVPTAVAAACTRP